VLRQQLWQTYFLDLLSLSFVEWTQPLPPAFSVSLSLSIYVSSGGQPFIHPKCSSLPSFDPIDRFALWFPPSFFSFFDIPVTFSLFSDFLQDEARVLETSDTPFFQTQRIFFASLMTCSGCPATAISSLRVLRRRPPPPPPTPPTPPPLPFWQVRLSPCSYHSAHPLDTYKDR